MRYVRFALLDCAPCLLLGEPSALGHGAKKAGAGAGGYTLDYAGQALTFRCRSDQV